MGLSVPESEDPAPPSRAEFDQLAELCQQLRKDLDIQFKGIAQLQADIDLIRAAWTKVSPRGD